MTTEVAEHVMSAPTEMGDYEPYRALSKAAIASVVLGLLGLLGLLFPALLVLPLVGMFCAWTALSTSVRCGDGVRRP